MHSRRNKQRLRLLTVFSFSFVIIFLVLFFFSIPFPSLVYSKLDFEFSNVLAIPNVPSTNNTSTSIPPDNQPPVANAGKNQTVNENTTVTLNGIATDPDPDDNDNLSYLWKQTAGPAIVLNDSNTENPIFITPPVPSDSVLNFSLIAEDDKGAKSNPDFVSITVKHLNRPPISNAGVNQTVNPGYVVSLGGTGSRDPDNDPITYSWKQTEGPSVKLNDANSAISTFVAPKNISADTEMIFELTVTDDKNSIAVDNTQVIAKYIPPLNQPPMADAGLDQTVDAGTAVTLDGGGSTDADGNISSYSWTQTEGPAVTLSDVNAPSPTFTAPSVSSDTILRFSLTVKDDKGETSSPVTVAVTVKAAVSPAPPITPPISNQTISGNATSMLAAPSNQTEGSGSDEYVFVIKWGSEGSGDGQFMNPAGVDIDSSGNVYVADNNNHRIQKFDSDGNFNTKWGSEGSGDGQFSYPADVALDSSGNVYVADTVNSRIQKFDSSGNFITKWGSYGTGDGQFDGTVAVAADSSGDVYVADLYNNRIQKFDNMGAL